MSKASCSGVNFTLSHTSHAPYIKRASHLISFNDQPQHYEMNTTNYVASIYEIFRSEVCSTTS